MNSKNNNVADVILELEIMPEDAYELMGEIDQKAKNMMLEFTEYMQRHGVNSSLDGFDEKFALEFKKIIMEFMQSKGCHKAEYGFSLLFSTLVAINDAISLTLLLSDKNKHYEMARAVYERSMTSNVN